MKITISLSLLLFLLLPEFNFPVAAQPGSIPGSTPNNSMYTSFSSSLGIIMAILITSLFFMALFSIYIRNCNGSSSGSVPAINSRGVVRAGGLDRSVLDTFPTFTYSEVKEHKIVNGALECAVCLNEFEDDETLRLIPKCDHVFHPECIDAWLEFHVTCPVCRADLVPKPGDEPVRVPDLINNEGSMRNENNIVESSNSRNDEIVIEVDDGPVMVNRNLSFHYPIRPRPIPFGVDKFRSYSTGNSLVRPVKDLERFTLRLPAEVRKEGIERAMLNPHSIAARLPREGSSRKGYRTRDGEGGSRGGRFYRIDRSDQEVKSDRWDFVSRAFSTTSRSQKVVEGTEEGSGSGSTSKGAGNRTPVKVPSFKCLEPKAVDETDLFSDKLVRHEI